MTRFVEYPSSCTLVVKYLKPTHLKAFGSKKTTGPKKNNQNQLSSLSLGELSFMNNCSSAFFIFFLFTKYNYIHHNVI